MKLMSIRDGGREKACVLHRDRLFPLETLPGTPPWPPDLLSLISEGRLEALNAWYRARGAGCLDGGGPGAVPLERASPAPLYRRPRKIWGIGLNYREHARDLDEKAPSAEPASFMKPDTAIIGPGDTIEIPVMSEKTTAEAELGIVLGKRCRHVPREGWLGVVAGYTTIIDMTAEDILRRNPRNLTQSKSFDTFFSFGPALLTPDEVPDVMRLEVSTVVNGEVRARNVVSNMTFPPDFLVSYHSRIMTMLPGDIISTGTPGAAAIADGDVVECRIGGFPALYNKVMDLKNPAGPSAGQ